MDKIVTEGLTYDDVLLVPRMGSTMPRDVSTGTHFCRGVALQIPVASAAMDTVTESQMAVALALEGGIGIVHKNMTVVEQVAQVDRVKRSSNGVILDPVTLDPEASVGHARELMRDHRCSGFPIVDPEMRVLGILTRRDLRFVESPETPVSEVMTRDGLVTAPPETTLEQAREILQRN